MAELDDLDDAARERIFQEELAKRRAMNRTQWERFRSLAWYWQALAWAGAWPVPLALLAMHRRGGIRWAIGSATAVAAFIWVAMLAAPFSAPPDESDSASLLASGASPSTTTTVPVATTAPPTTAAPTTVPPTTAAPTTVPPTTTAPPTTAAPVVAAPPAVMPNVVCMNLQVAQDVIQTHGVFFSRSHDATGQERFQVLDSNWVVVAQHPAPGAPVDELEAVLEVVKIGEPSGC